MKISEILFRNTSQAQIHFHFSNASSNTSFHNHRNLTLASLIPFHQEHESFPSSNLLRFTLTNILRLHYYDMFIPSTMSKKFSNLFIVAPIVHMTPLTLYAHHIITIHFIGIKLMISTNSSQLAPRKQ